MKFSHTSSNGPEVDYVVDEMLKNLKSVITSSDINLYNNQINHPSVGGNSKVFDMPHFINRSEIAESVKA